MNELKPCPFCGRHGTVNVFDRNEMEGVRKGEEGYNAHAFYTVCCNTVEGGCGACGGYYYDKNQTIRAWNRRAGEVEADKLKYENAMLKELIRKDI